MFVGSLTMTYFRAVYPALSSALRRFTVLFGMGRRGSNALWSSEKTVAAHATVSLRRGMLALNNAGRSKVGGGDRCVTQALQLKLRKELAVIGSSHTGN